MAKRITRCHRPAKLLISIVIIEKSYLIGLPENSVQVLNLQVEQLFESLPHHRCSAYNYYVFALKCGTYSRVAYLIE